MNNLFSNIIQLVAIVAWIMGIAAGIVMKAYTMVVLSIFFAPISWVELAIWLKK